MPTPGEHKTVQARILAYAQEIGWSYVPRGEAERRRGFDFRTRSVWLVCHSASGISTAVSPSTPASRTSITCRGCFAR
jgi:hypothetical protein